MSASFSLNTLMSTTSLRDCPLKSRLVLAPIRLGHSLETDTDNLIAFYRERVEDGAGLVIIGNGVIHPSGKLFADDFCVNDASVKHLVRIVDAIRSSGGASILQLIHHGALVDSPFPLAASRHYISDTQRTTVALPGFGIPHVIDHYVQAARLAVQGAQFDGIEVYAARYSLPNTFISPALNRRRDRWGGNNRAEFSIELAKRLRHAIGEERLLGFRVSLLDLHREGNSWHELISLLLRLQTIGVDYFAFDIGFSSNRFPICSDLTPVNTWLEAMVEVASLVDVPVLFGKKLSLDERLQSIAVRFPNTLFEFARPWLADAQLFRKLRAGEAPTPCLYCKDCFGNGFGNGKPFVCKNRPVETTPIHSHLSPKKILVVGAGISGMQAAITAARLGHDVTLVDRNTEPGGALLMLSRIPGRQRYRAHINAMTKAVTDLNIKSRFGYEASPQTIIKDYPEREIVVATGRRPGVIDYDGQGNTNLMTYEDLLRDKMPVGHRVMVIASGRFGLDTTRFLTGIAADELTPEEWLCAWGIGSLKEHPGGQYGFIPHLTTSKRTIYFVCDNKLPLDSTLSEHYRAHEMQWLRMCGVQTLENSEITSVDPYSVTVHFNDTNHDEVLRVDHIVVCTGTLPATELYDDLSELGRPTHLVGSGAVMDEWLDIEGIEEQTDRIIQELFG